jgi:hypothetical protein
MTKCTQTIARTEQRHFNLFSIHYQNSLVALLNAASEHLNGVALSESQRDQVRAKAHQVMSRAA